MNIIPPAFKVQQDESYLVLETKYFTLQYLKNKPFAGPKYAAYLGSNGGYPVNVK